MALQLAFDTAWYLARNPDVAEAVLQGRISAEAHFAQYGKAEGRSGNPLFNARDYLAANPDVADAVARGETTAYDHFINHGAAEGRSPLALFDAAFYLSQNPDVQATGAGLANAVVHFILYGAGELRQIHPAIDLAAYASANADVAQAVSQGLSALTHLQQYGIAEARDLGNGILLSAFGNDAKFTSAINSGALDVALNRVAEVSPFLPSFQKPSSWTPPSNLPIPLDFTPLPGTKLVVPAGVAVPEGVVLPDTFQPNGGETGGGDNGGGGTPNPTFSATLDGSGELTFSGTASGNITVSIDGSNQVTFVRGGISSSQINFTDIAKITVASGQLLHADADQMHLFYDGSAQTPNIRPIEGAGSLRVDGTAGSQTFKVETTGQNLISGGGGADWIHLGSGTDTLGLRFGSQNGQKQSHKLTLDSNLTLQQDDVYTVGLTLASGNWTISSGNLSNTGGGLMESLIQALTADAVTKGLPVSFAADPDDASSILMAYTYVGAQSSPITFQQTAAAGTGHATPVGAGQVAIASPGTGSFAHSSAYNYDTIHQFAIGTDKLLLRPANDAANPNAPLPSPTSLTLAAGIDGGITPVSNAHLLRTALKSAFDPLGAGESGLVEVSNAGNFNGTYLYVDEGNGNVDFDIDLIIRFVSMTGTPSGGSGNWAASDLFAV